MRCKILVCVATFFLMGCSESHFNLSSNSRLPKWISIPNGTSRQNINVTLDYYIYPSSREAVFKVYEKDNFFRLEKIVGLLQGSSPLALKNPPKGFPKGYPAYEVVTVGGVTDIVEHRAMESIFYMVDDPAIWKELGVEQK